MNELEQLVNTNSKDEKKSIDKKTIGSTIKESAQWYAKSLVNTTKTLAFPLLVSSVGAVAGPEIVKELGYSGEVANTISKYVLGYGVGYSTIFGVEYLRHKKEYGSIFSKKLGKWAASFLMSDYVSDPLAFQPVFLALNFGPMHKPNIPEWERTFVSWNAAGLVWISAMAVGQPLFQEINKYTTDKVKKGYQAIKKLVTSTNSSGQ